MCSRSWITEDVDDIFVVLLCATPAVDMKIEILEHPGSWNKGISHSIWLAPRENITKCTEEQCLTQRLTFFLSTIYFYLCTQWIALNKSHCIHCLLISFVGNYTFRNPHVCLTGRFYAWLIRSAIGYTKCQFYCQWPKNSNTLFRTKVSSYFKVC